MYNSKSETRKKDEFVCVYTYIYMCVCLILISYSKHYFILM